VIAATENPEGTDEPAPTARGDNLRERVDTDHPAVNVHGEEGGDDRRSGALRPDLQVAIGVVLDDHHRPLAADGVNLALPVLWHRAAGGVGTSPGGFSEADTGEF